MRTIALDATRDFDLTARTLTLVEGAPAVAQRLRGRMRLWRGAWFGDLRVGTLSAAFMGAKGGARLAEATLRAAAATCPGVASLESFTFRYTASARAAVVAFRARTGDGAVVEDGGFTVGA